MVSTLNNNKPARDIGYGVVQCLLEAVAFDTPQIGTSDKVQIGSLPAGAKPLRTTVQILEAFNAATTNVLTAGTSAGSNADFVADGDVDEAALDATLCMRCADVVLSETAETPIYAKYTQTGTAATAGRAIFVVEYVVPSNG